MDNFQPMLAGKVKDTSKLLYPVIVSPKLDGIRAVSPNGDVLLSRKLLPIPNLHVQAMFGRPEFKYYDGELIVGDPWDKDCYNTTFRGVMKKDGTPDVKYYVFDHFKFWGEAFGDRLGKLPERLPEGVVVVEQHIVYTEAELLRREQEWLDQGYEGLMVRSVTSPYKFGRSTDREGFLLKLKRFSDDDCEIIGVEELMSNQNTATKDELGRTKRATDAEGLVPMGTMGALQVRDVKSGVEFNIGTGFSAAEREVIWRLHESGRLIGCFGKYKSFKIGVKDKPRFPVWLGFRAKEDMS